MVQKPTSGTGRSVSGTSPALTHSVPSGGFDRAQLIAHAEQGNTMNIIEKSRETVEQLLARRNLPKTYEEKCQYALDLVDMHLHEENPDRIDECIKLYTEDAIWETPA